MTVLKTVASRLLLLVVDDEVSVLGECAQRMRKTLHGLTSAADRMLLTARWAGNVRELKNAIERACVLAEGHTISERELAGALGPDAPALGVRSRAAEPVPRTSDPHGVLEDVDRERIIETLRQVYGNRMAAAKVLGISRRALCRRLERHHIVDETPRRSAGRSLR